MAFDAHKNLAVSSVATAPSPPASGGTLTVAPGEGVRFPAAPFNATVWQTGVMPTPANAELIRVTAVAADTFTITRAQESSTARAIVAGDVIAATVTVKTLADVESGTNFPLITTPGPVTFSGASGGTVKTNGTAGALTLSGSGTPGSGGSYINIYGDTYPGNNGSIDLIATGTAGHIAVTAKGSVDFYNGPTSQNSRMHPSGGLSWGGTTDPGAGNVSATGHILSKGGGRFEGVGNSAGATGPGLEVSTYQGEGYVTAYDRSAAGYIPLRFAASVVNCPCIFAVPSGYSITHATPGAGTTGCGLGSYAGMASGFYATGATTAATNIALFQNPSGTVGYIQISGSTTLFSTTSDARLKHDRGPHTDLSVLQHTKVHAFDWRTDHTPGRGVFAQEAIDVAPFAVTPGTDERDDDGHLRHPWAVDYAKYVPDLIAGWQHHAGVIQTLHATVAALEDRIAALEARLNTAPPPHTP